MDDVTADLLLDKLRQAKLPGGGMTIEEKVDVLVLATEAEIRCQHSSGLRQRAIDNKLSKLVEVVGESDGEGSMKHRFDEVEQLIQSCPARRPDEKKEHWRLGPITSTNIQSVIIIILLFIIAALTGTDLSALFGGK